MGAVFLMGFTLAFSSALAPFSALAAPTVQDFEWLEDSKSKQTLEWIENQNKKEIDQIEKLQLFRDLKNDALKVLEPQERMIVPDIFGDVVLDFMKDKDHRRGILRLSSKAAYFEGNAKWETILDIDALSKDEGKAWVYQGMSCLKPQNIHCLLYLSEGGSDFEELREYNLAEKRFVKNGFKVPAGRNSAQWLDESSILLSDATKKEDQTQGGYPRVVRLIKRDDGIDKGKTLFSGSESDARVRGMVLENGSSKVIIFDKMITFGINEYFLPTSKGLEKIKIPENSLILGISADQLIIQIRSNFEQYLSGSVLSTDLSSLNSKKLKFELVFGPTREEAFSSLAIAKDAIYLIVQQDVKSRLLKVTRSSNNWVAELKENKGSGVLRFVFVEETSHEVIVSYEDFITPTQLILYAEGTKNPRTIAQSPSFFSSDRFIIEQNFALSKDSTQIPYFVVRAKNSKLDGTNPTMLTGYGGFSLSQLPAYSPITAKLWLERGGVLVWSNVRGGGEFGPDWHKAAIRENRQVAYDDFEAVARDVIKRRITSPENFAIKGTSNGGLLIGVAFTQHPELYKAAVSVMPLLDMLRYTHLAAGQSWIGEYGDPDKADEAKYLRKYSPYHNLKVGVKYPDVFISASSQDNRVHPAHARKMAAYLEKLNQSILFYEDNIGGHGRGNNADDLSSELARQFTFLWLKLRPGMIVKDSL